MAQITITIPDNVKTRVIEGFCYGAGYQDQIFNPDYNPNVKDSKEKIPNPMNKAAFVKTKIMQYVKETVMAYESQVAAKTAHDAAQVDVNSKINLT